MYQLVLLGGPVRAQVERGLFKQPGLVPNNSEKVWETKRQLRTVWAAIGAPVSLFWKRGKMEDGGKEQSLKVGSASWEKLSRTWPSLAGSHKLNRCGYSCLKRPLEV